jgi:hypothetical protein
MLTRLLHNSEMLLKSLDQKLAARDRHKVIIPSPWLRLRQNIHRIHRIESGSSQVLPSHSAWA